MEYSIIIFTGMMAFRSAYPCPSHQFPPEKNAPFAIRIGCIFLLNRSFSGLFDRYWLFGLIRDCRLGSRKARNRYSER